MEDELIWPRKKPQPTQFLRIVGKRKANEPALLPCYGSCSSQELTWTQHARDSGSSYFCIACNHRRQWGLNFWSR